MKLKNVLEEVFLQLMQSRWDRIIEKHEGPWDWSNELRDKHVEFMIIDGFEVLLPIDKQHHTNITIDRCIPSLDGKSLTIFLHDRTYDMGMEMLNGRLAVCERMPAQDWYVAIVYHECWISKLASHD